MTTEHLPLLAGQQGVWYAQELEPDTPFNVGEYLEIHGPVDQELVRRAHERVVQEAEAFRLRFIATPDGPRQSVTDDPGEPITELDLAAEPDPRAAAEAWMAADAARPVAPLRDPLLRAALIRLADDHWILYRRSHHIAVDGWSWALLARRTTRIYAELALGRPAGPGFPPLRTLLDAQAEYRASPAFDADRGYWLGRFADGLEPVSLSDATPGPGFSRVRRTLPAVPIRSAAERLGLRWTEFAVTAVAAYLARATGCTEVVVGLPVTARGSRPEREVPGLAANVLPLRLSVHPADRPRELAARVTAEVLRTLRHARYRSEDLRRDLNRVGDRAALYGPVVNAMAFDYELDFAGSPVTAHTVSDVPVDDLVLALYERSRDADLQLVLDANAGRYPRADAVTQAERITRFLAEFAALDPDTPVGSLDLADPADRTPVVTAGTGGAPLARLFAAQARRTPEHPAVEHAGSTLRYAELDARANRLAHLLLDRGAGQERLVAVSLPRGADRVVAFLGVLKAGAAYLPIDPSYPDERVRHLLADSAATLSVTGADIVAAATHPDTAPEVAVDAAHPAYVIYTSGSTGTPKGVVVTHAGLADLARTHAERLGVGADSRVLQFASPGFDAAVWELVMALLGGGCLVVPDDAAIEPGRPLATTLATARITHVTLPPSVAAVTPERDLPGLRVVLAGEAVTEGLVRRWAPGRELVNAYGPTETTVCATTSAPLRGGEVPGIGTAVPGAGVLVLDGALRPAASGAVAELYVTGPLLARGYLGRAGQTAERFVACPFGPPGTRMYRTGDLVRRVGAALHYVGRADEQVKVRGFRVEPGEIRAALAAMDEVADAAVATRDGALVAYLVPAGGHPPEPADVRERLRATLPAHLVPSVVTVLERLPLTAHGKLDHAALPGPAVSGAGRPPATPAEEFVCAVFAEVLGVAAVGPEDGFFDLGGHSLLATRLVGRVRTELGAELTVRHLFDAPTPALLAALLPELDRARAAIRPRPRPERVPLSVAQRRLWFLHRLGEPDSAYTVALSVRLRGELDRPALAGALADVARRHEVLRTVFAEQDGEPHQVLVDRVPPLPVTNLAPEHLAGRLRSAAAAGFDLARDLPIRAELFALEDREHVLLVVLHHIAADGWSVAPFVGDLAEAYTARHAGTAPSWTPLPVQYADVALCEAESTDPAPDDAGLDYWRTTLAGAPALLDLPLDRARPAVAERSGDTVPFTIPGELAARLAVLARETGTTVFMVLHAALATVLSRVGAGEDIPVGTPVAARSDDALTGMVGFFVNTLVLRTDLGGNPAFTDLLARVRARTLAAYAHQDVPFERLVEDLNPTRSLAHHPLFQVMLSFDNIPGSAGAGAVFAGLDTEVDEVDTGGVKFDLAFSLTERAHGMRGVLTYRTDLFERAGAEALADRFVRVLRAVAADPGARVGELDVLTAAEAHRVLVSWNDTGSAPAGATVPELFHAQALRTPDAVAVVCGGTALRYAELAERARVLSRRLAAEGAGPERVVGVSLPRSADLVVALLGVLGAGAAYLPIDPRLPAERVRTLLTDAGAELVVGDRAVPARLVRPGDAGPETDPLPAAPGNTAYVLYTSGSTGVPKGVAVAHASVTALLGWAHGYLGDALDRVLAATSAAFDVSVFELFAPLTRGGSVHVVDDLLALLDTGTDATLVSGVPSAVSGLLAAGGDLGPAVRTVVLAGEALPATLAARLAVDRGVEVVNLYGPTESTVYATGWRGTGTPRIGRPIAYTRAYVLDSRLRPTPPGVPGELYLAGAGLARGYLGRPALTAERFLGCPFGPPGARMYRTGDRVRWGVDGELDYLGRVDDQVKIRGFRVEPAEAEHALSRHRAVAEAAVLVREDTPGERRLVGYVVPASPSWSAAAVRADLAGELPDYLVPAALVPLETLPLTRNGKLDRATLPAPRYESTVDRPARDPREDIVRGLFAAVLDVPAVGQDDDFFVLGGHSLLAVRLVGRVRTALNAELAVRDLFEAPTPARLCALLSTVDAARPPVVPVPRPARPPLSYAQRRLWFLDRMQGPAATYNLPLALRLRGELDPAALAAALADVLGRHDALRTRFPEHDGEAWQEIVEQPSSPLASRETTAEAVPALVAEQAARPFDLATELPVRCALLAVRPDEHVLVLVLHHIAADGWSLAPLLADLSSAYAARVAGGEPDWRPLPVQYVDYVLWQRDVLADRVETQLAHWREVLAGAPDELRLPADRPRPAAASHAGGEVRLAVPAWLHREVVATAREHGVTVFMVVQAALAALLSRLGAGTDIPLGTVVAGRDDDSLDGLVGFFVNTLVLRTDVGGDPTFGELLARVRETDLDAFAHQDVPFDRLVQAVNPARSAGRHPLFQVMLSSNDTAATALRLPGVEVEQLEPANHTAKFDLDVRIRERHGADGAQDGIACEIEYASDVFDEPTVLRLGELLVRTLELACAEPAVPFGALAVLPADDPWVLGAAVTEEAVPGEIVTEPAAGPTRFRDQREELVAGLVAEVLDLQRPPGRLDGFFDLGGHSLSAVRLLSRVRAVFGRSIPVRALFDDPTVRGIVDRLGDADGAGAALVPVPRPDRVPLSFAQRRLWFLHRLEGPSSTYNLAWALRLTGALDAGALRAALADLLDRHEALRTVFPDDAGTPWQRVLPAAEYAEASFVDTSEGALGAAMDAACRHEFLLDAEIPFRATVFRLRGQEHVLLIVAHHIAADGWSLAPLLRDLATAYAARAAGAAPSWTPLPVQYADYTLWHHDRLGAPEDAGSVTSRQVAFWRETLAGAPERLDLPTDLPRPAVAGTDGASVRFSVPADVHARLAAVAMAHGVTVFMVVQAALAALLSRLGAGTDLPIGTVVAGRTEQSLDELVGFFVNTVVLRTDAGGDPTFAELLARVRETDLDAFAHQDVPFERLVEVLNPSRTLAHHPLFQVMLAFNNTARAGVEFPGLGVAEEPVGLSAARCDLSFGMGERADGGVDGVVIYRTDLFEHATLAALAERFVRALDRLTARPDLRLSDLDVLLPGERALLVEGWNDTARDREPTTLPELFASQVARTPTAVALRYEGESVSYAELGERVERLAGVLAAHGAGPERFVTVVMTRSVELVVAIWAVLRTGAAYVPVDPDYPAERIAHIHAETGAVVVLAQPHTAGATAGTVLTVDTSGAVASTASAPVTGPAPDNPAYAIFTSGSTGRPKGVLVPHAAVANLVLVQRERLGTGVGDRVLQFVSPSFDVAVWELTAALLTGATLVLAPPHRLLPGPDLAALLAEHAITHLTLPVPALAALPDGALPEGTTVVIGGEQCPPDLVATFSPGRRMLNGYGPTETTVTATMSEPLAGRVSPPIGTPVANTAVYLLDEALRPVPRGVPGELYVAGAGLARGYLGRHGMTAERFVACPFGAGTRMYRTGDLARRRVDGALEFLGRVDDQVKLRGFRIEPGEVEAVLRACPGVTAAAVVVREDRPGQRRLVGYLAPPVDLAPVRERVSRTLPDYLVPAAFVTLPALPLTPNGKVDQAALPAPTAERGTGRAPRGAAEETIAAIMADILGVPVAGAQDSFFQLGGDSISSIRLVSRAGEAGLRLTPREVFQHRTVEALASVAAVAGSRPERAAESEEGRFPAPPIVRWMLEQDFPWERFEQSVLLRVPAAVDERSLRAALTAVLDHHAMLRARLAEDDMLEVRPAGTVPATVHRVDAVAVDLAEVVPEHAGRARDRLAPRAGEVFQAVWFDRGPARPGAVLLLAHHLVVDAVSWQILVPDLARAWSAVAAGEVVRLPPTGTSMRAWAHRLAALDRRAELPHWREQLAGTPPEHERPAAGDTAAGSMLLRLPASRTEALLTETTAAYHAKVSDVLLTALALAAGCAPGPWPTVGHLVVDVESHGRAEVVDDIDLSRTVGWFTSVAPYRLDPGPVQWHEVTDGGTGLGTALKRVKEQLRAAPDGGIGYGVLRYLDPATEAELAALPGARLAFNYLGRVSVSAGGDWSVLEDVRTDDAAGAPLPPAYDVLVTATVVDRAAGRELEATWTWPEGAVQGELVRELARNWLVAVEALIRHSADPDAGGYTPSDLSLVSLRQGQLDKLQARWKSRG